MRRIIDRLVDLVMVPRCSGCRKRMETRGNTLCDKCYDRYKDAKAVYCDFCGMEASVCNCVPQRLLMSGCADYRKLAFYKADKEAATLRNMIYSVKRGYNLVLMRFLMHELSALDAYESPENSVVTYVPRSRAAFRRYGYDQGKQLARMYARENGLAFVQLFRRRFRHHDAEQKLLNYAQRAENMRGAFVLRSPQKVAGRNVLLIDDVVTSGSTVAECTSMLYAAGAKNVAVRSIACTYRKNKHKKD